MRYIDISIINLTDLVDEMSTYSMVHEIKSYAFRILLETVSKHLEVP